MKASLRKVKWNKGSTDKGHEYDYTRIYIEVPVYDKQEKEFGLDTIELEFGSEAEHTKLSHLRGKLPVDVDVDFQVMKKGNTNINVVTKLDILPNHAEKLLKPEQPK